MKRSLCLSSILASLFILSANAESPKARLVEKGVSAFECSVAAAMAPMAGHQESNRLFMLGYNSLVSFADALYSGEISEAEYDKYVTLHISLLLSKTQGDTSATFATGRIYQHVLSYTSDRIFYARNKTGGIDRDKPLNDEQIGEMANQLYSEANCSLID
tara:strand:+ start:242 stop:721 length:480 start_codon:yes stop_codon:yes gene_type:complete